MRISFDNDFSPECCKYQWDCDRGYTVWLRLNGCSCICCDDLCERNNQLINLSLCPGCRNAFAFVVDSVYAVGFECTVEQLNLRCARKTIAADNIWQERRGDAFVSQCECTRTPLNNVTKRAGSMYDDRRDLAVFFDFMASIRF